MTETDRTVTFGRFYIGCHVDGEPLRFYSWDSWGWKLVTLEEAKERCIIFTRMSLAVAKDSIKEIRNAGNGEYKDLKLFLIPKEDAGLWGIVEVD